MFIANCLSRLNPAYKYQEPKTHSGSPIRQLLTLITKSVSTLEKSCDRHSTLIPDLHEPFYPSSETFREDPIAAEAASIIVAASLQLAAILAPPQVSLYHVVGGHFKSAALRVCLESNVTEILREAGPKGLHVEDLAAKNGQDPQKLGRFLRILATHHIYRELTPEVFTNSRISSLLDTLKPSKELFADPELKHDNTPGLAALASHHLDEAFKASAYAWETVSDPKLAVSDDPDASPFATAMGTRTTLWQFYERPEEQFRHHRFSTGIQGIQALQPPDAVLQAYNWKCLVPGSVVVYVGGGVGTSSLPLARDYPWLNIVIQDLPSVIEQGNKLWTKKMPKALECGRVKLEAHDFFTPQTRKDVSVFLLKQTLHEWSDEYCVRLLTHLRDAATTQTKLVILESLIPFACHDPSADNDKGIPGAVPREAPEPLLANYGAVNEMGYNADMDMFLLFNSQERTIRHIDWLLRRAGWQVLAVHRQPGDSTFLQPMVAVPIGK